MERKPKTKTAHVRMDPSLYIQLKIIAKAENRSISGQIVYYVARAVAGDERESARAAEG